MVSRTTNDPAGPVSASERAAAAVALGLAPLLPAVAASATAQFLGAPPTRGTHFAALTFGWLFGAGALVRHLSRRWSHRAAPGPSHLFAAATAAFVTTVGVGVATAPWQELMSAPMPTPFMVVKDLTSTLASALAAVLVPWLVLAWRRFQVESTPAGKSAGAQMRPVDPGEADSSL